MGMGEWERERMRGEGLGSGVGGCGCGGRGLLGRGLALLWESEEGALLRVGLGNTNTPEPDPVCTRSRSLAGGLFDCFFFRLLHAESTESTGFPSRRLPQKRPPALPPCGVQSAMLWMSCRALLHVWLSTAWPG